MADDHADVIVLGLGGMGSSAALALSRRGVRVIGIERYGPAHAHGSSHGHSRVIRQAYLEHPSYVPLVLEAYDLWQSLERDSGESLLHETGGLMIGPESCQTVAGSVLSAQTWDLDYELLDGRDIARRWPLMTPRADDIALYEPHAGWVPPERAVTAQLQLAGDRGADLRFNTRVLEWQTRSGEVTVRTPQGSATAGAMIICAGPWTPSVVPELAEYLLVERQVQVWLTPAGGPEPFLSMPVWLWEDDEDRMAYGFPAMPGDPGVKAALMRNGRPIDPDDLSPDTNDSDVEPLARYLASRIPSMVTPALQTTPCMYTNSPDHHFIIGQHPSEPIATIAAGFSGHGFKFVPVIGEILADLALTASTDRDIGLFAPNRLALGANAS